MDKNLDDELSFLNDKNSTEKNNHETKTETPKMETNNSNNHSVTNNNPTSKLENYLEKENVLRLIIEKWNVDANAGTAAGKKSVTDKEDVLKSIIYNWQV